MFELKNITALTNKREAEDFATVSEYGRQNTYLLIIFQCKAQYSYNGKDFFRIPKNSVVIYSPYHMQAYKSDNGPFLNSFLAFYVEKDYFKRFRFPLNEVFSCTEKEIEEILDILDKISFILNTDYELYNREKVPHMAESILKILSDNFETNKLLEANNFSIHALFSQIRNEMFADPIKMSVKEMAKQSGYTETYFGICYKSFFNITPVKDRQIQIIKIAKELLETSNYSIEKISEICGLESVSYFITMFKKHENITPHQYRLRNQKIKQMVDLSNKND